MTHRLTVGRTRTTRAGVIAGCVAASLLAAPGPGYASPPGYAGPADSPAPRVLPSTSEAGPYAFSHQAGRLRVQPVGRTGAARATELPTGGPAAAVGRQAAETHHVSFTVPPLPGAESKLLYVWNRANWAWNTPVKNPANSRLGSAELPAGDYLGVALLLTFDSNPISLLATPFTVTGEGAQVTFDDRTVETRVALDDPTARRSDGAVWISVPGGDAVGVGSGVRPVRVTPFSVPGASLRLHEVLTSGGPSGRRYDIFHEFAGSVPAQPVAQVATAGLARTTTTIRAEGGEPAGGALLSWPNLRERVAVPLRSAVAVPGSVTEFVTPGLSFTRTVDVGAGQGTFDLGSRTFTAGTNPDETVGAAPTAPRRFEWGSTTRSGDTIELREHARFDDAAGHLGTAQGVRQSIRLTSDGRTVASGTDLPAGETWRADVDPAPARYELTHTLTRQAPWSRLSTEVRNEWAFRSGRTSFPQRLPLIRVVPDVSGLDVRNTAGADPVRVTAVAHGEESEATVSAIEYSTDDGVTWQSLPVSDGTAQLSVPASAAFVSLRVTAADQQGGSVRHTVVRAFAGLAR